MIFLSIMSIGLVSAANTVTLLTPTVGELIDGNAYVLNATLDSSTLNATNASFYYRIGAGAWVVIDVNVPNNTLTGFNVTWDSTSIIDVDDVTFNVSISNSSEATVISDDTSLLVTINNTAPTFTFDSPVWPVDTGIPLVSAIVIHTSTDTNGLDWCTLTIQGISSVYAASGNACNSSSLTPNTFSILQGRVYEAVLEVKDGNNDTISLTRDIYIEAVGGDSPLAGTGEVTSSLPTTASVPTVVLQEQGAFARFFNAIGNFFRNLFSGSN